MEELAWSEKYAQNSVSLENWKIIYKEFGYNLPGPESFS